MDVGEAGSAAKEDSSHIHGHPRIQANHFKLRFREDHRFSHKEMQRRRPTAFSDLEQHFFDVRRGVQYPR